MTSTALVGGLGALAILGSVLRLVVQGRLRVRYAALWLAVSAGLVVITFLPGVLTSVATRLGFAVPANLLFFAGLILLVLVGIHLSVAVTRLEDRVQRLAEELVLLADRVNHAPGAPGAPGSGRRDPGEGP
jgi:hypothetical protein